ncbi:small kinetochore-associated protein isoform X2 [Solea solea]|uniref:small kinetochore-associated protein isoform X2 n=1 Tax=Solea solea TaxID=90069 RepID=UPI00272BC1B3|nr:small kinetochore-associated protein isoform X2 [Solea solea]
MSSKIPRGTQLPVETKKIGHRFESRDTATASATATAAQKSDGVLRPQKENVQRKNAAPKVHKVVSTRYGQQVELKEQNQHLTTVNEELQKNLTETQQRLAELELEFTDLEKENAQAQKNLKDCHILLVTAKIDPGGKVGEDAQQNEDQRKEAMSVSTDLLKELRTFGDVASKQRSRLEEIQTMMTNLTKAREHMMQERESFSLDTAEMEEALKEAQALLL